MVSRQILRQDVRSCVRDLGAPRDELGQNFWAGTFHHVLMAGGEVSSSSLEHRSAAGPPDADRRTGLAAAGTLTAFVLGSSHRGLTPGAPPR